jgi:hypothetical protein
MKNTANATISSIYIANVEHLYMDDNFKLANASHIHIEKVEHLHMGNSEPATPIDHQRAIMDSPLDLDSLIASLCWFATMFY